MAVSSTEPAAESAASGEASSFASGLGVALSDFVSWLIMGRTATWCYLHTPESPFISMIQQPTALGCDPRNDSSPRDSLAELRPMSICIWR